MIESSTAGLYKSAIRSTGSILMRLLFIQLVWVFFSCGSDEVPVLECIDNSPSAVEDLSIEHVIESSECILQYASTGRDERWEYTHDGTNYNKLVYYENYTRDTLPLWTTHFQYDEQNRVSRTMQVWYPNDEFGWETLFQYDPYLTLTFTLFDTAGNVDLELYQEAPYYKASIDSLFLLDGDPSFPIIMGFEEGNRTTFFVEEPASTCELYGSRWQQTVRDYYDDRPNVFSDYAVLLSSSFPTQYWFWGNANNLIGTFDFSSASQEVEPAFSEFLTDNNGNYWIKKHNNRVYHYDCE